MAGNVVAEGQTSRHPEPEMRPESPRLTRMEGPGGYAFPPVPMDGIYLDYNGSAPDRSLSRQAEDVGRTASVFGRAAHGR